MGAQYPELGIDEYLRLIRLFVGLGITKVRLTGGEPLLRRGLVELIQELAALRTLWDEPLDLALTTNGHLLESLAAPLKAAGLNRVTVSMDAVDAPTFERITRVPGSFETVLRGIRAARDAGLKPLKINCVLLRGFNDDQVEAFARFARQENVVVRFIEFMPLEEGRLWTPEIVVPLNEIVARIGRVMPLVELPRAMPARPRAATLFPTASARSASSRPSPRPFAEHAAACGSPLTAKSAPASSRRSSTISTDDSAPAPAMRNCAIIFFVPSKARKPATTSASPDSSSLRGRWCTSAADCLLAACFLAFWVSPAGVSR